MITPTGCDAPTPNKPAPGLLASGILLAVAPRFVNSTQLVARVKEEPSE